ncbi:hypothetical protein [Nostoc sp.]
MFLINAGIFLINIRILLYNLFPSRTLFAALFGEVTDTLAEILED